MLKRLDREVLSEFGFNESDLDLYFALLRVGEGTIADCLRFSSVGRTAAYAIMKKLVGWGLVAEVSGRPVRFRALPPEVALREFVDERVACVRRRHEERLRELDGERSKELDFIHKRLPAAAKELLLAAQELYSGGEAPADDESDVVILRGAKAVFDILHHITVRRVARIIFRPPILIPPDERLGLAEAKFAAQKGIERRLLCETQMLSKPEFVIPIWIHLEAGHPVRHLPALPGKVLIFDDATAIVSLRANSDPKRSISMLVRNRELIGLHIAAFDALWQKAEEVSMDQIKDALRLARRFGG